MSQQNKYRDADKNLYDFPVSLKIKSVDEIESGGTVDLEVGEICISKSIEFKTTQIFQASVVNPGLYGVFNIPDSLPSAIDNDNGQVGRVIAFSRAFATSFRFFKVSSDLTIKSTVSFGSVATPGAKVENYVFISYQMRVMIIRFA